MRISKKNFSKFFRKILCSNLNYFLILFTKIQGKRKEKEIPEILKL